MDSMTRLVLAFCVCVQHSCYDIPTKDSPFIAFSATSWRNKASLFVILRLCAALSPVQWHYFRRGKALSLFMAVTREKEPCKSICHSLSHSFSLQGKESKKSFSFFLTKPDKRVCGEKERGPISTYISLSFSSLFSSLNARSKWFSARTYVLL